MGVICHSNFNSGVKKDIRHCESLFNSRPSCGIIRTTADYFLLPYMKNVCQKVHMGHCDKEMLFYLIILSNGIESRSLPNLVGCLGCLFRT
jgi:hypothetical protein